MAVSHVTQGQHLADRVEISKIDAFGWVLSIFNAWLIDQKRIGDSGGIMYTGGVSERDFETWRALYIRSLQLQP